jgi:hypothetical protein
VDDFYQGLKQGKVFGASVVGEWSREFWSLGIKQDVLLLLFYNK